MRVCLMIEGQEAVTWEQWLALAAACEEAGLEALFRSDHYTSVFGKLERGSLDAWATLAGLAARTQRLRLGTLVSPATFRHPSQLARVVATVDHISGGRVELGLGAGWYELEHRAHGFPFGTARERIERFAEQLELVHRQWTEEAFSFEGAYYVLEDCRALPKPVQRPRPPLIVGGSAKRGTVEPAVRFADEYNTAFASPQVCRERRRILDEACERAGRDPATLRFSLMTAGIVAGSERELARRTERVLERIGERGSPVRTMLEAGRDGWIAGTVEQVVERLAELEAAGVERVMLQHLAHDDLDMVALIGAEVLPRVTQA
jgi:F420-dependent oxidoreductase-like protein